MSTEEYGNSIKAAKDFLLRGRCEKQHLHFTRLFFKHRQGANFIVNFHHLIFADAVDRVIQGKAKNIVINVPPGSSKTEEVVINFIARGLALNPFSRFLHLSYSDTLASLNSQTARDIVTSDEFQSFWPLEICNDDSAKARWNVMVDGKKAGGCYATSLNGQVTGFRAGRMVPGFQGAILIDDPLKPEDAYSKPKRDAANRRLISTVKSRRANPDTPVVLIMQRLAEEDPTGFIKAGNLDELGEWEFITIPALIDDKYVEANKAFITPNIEALIDRKVRDKDGRFSYWPYKEPLDTLVKMESGAHQDKEGSRMSRFVFAGQYQQNPVALGGNLMRGEWFTRYKIKPRIKQRKIFVDTAQKTKERNDYSVFECWGEGFDGKIYLLDLLRGKWEAPELEKRALAFWAKHAALDVDEWGTLRSMNVEDKASGTGLIQSIKSKGKFPVIAIQRNIDKLTRVMDGIPHIEMGSVCIPEDAPYVNDFVLECEAFTADDTHAHDDQIDPMLDAIVEMLSNKNKLKLWENLA